jgi:hypothetical protein
LKTICNVKILKRILFLDFKIFPRAIPIIKYNRLQTGPKIHPGGLKDGLLMFVYQKESPTLTEYPDNIPRIIQSNPPSISNF